MIWRQGVMAVLAGGVAACVMIGATWRGADAASEPAVNPVTLRNVASFNGIADTNARSVALFNEAGKVIQSPRCLNCHPATERPTQGDRMLPHQPLVIRGESGMGAANGLVCTTCHREANFDPAGVPGNPKWALAPAEQAWQGKSLGQICEQIKDPARNGGKTMAALIDHMANDELVGWGWNPGKGRTPAPGTQKVFGEIFKAWADNGAVCPKG